MPYTIVIDAGHGGSDPGAVYEGRREKDDNLSLAIAVGELLSQQGVSVIYTRTTDVYQTPFEKAQMANQADADFFISFHRNSSEEPNQYTGVETLVYDNSGIKQTMAENINGCLLYTSKALNISYPPKQHPPAPESARTVRFRFYILYFAFFSRVRSAFPAFAGRYSSIQVPAFITSAQHTSDTECCFKNMVENTISTVRPRQTFRNTGRFLSCPLCSTATATATELYT